MPSRKIPSVEQAYELFSDDPWKPLSEWAQEWDCSHERVRQLKGEDRPINNEEDRRKVLETNRYVDSVVTFNSSEELKTLYETLCPDVVVKGSEWTADELRERDEIPDTIQVKVYPLVGDYSTTNTMEKIRNMGSCEKI